MAERSQTFLYSPSPRWSSLQLARSPHTPQPIPLGAISLLLVSVGLVLLPLGALLFDMLTVDLALWQHMWSTYLPRVLWNTVRLVVGVAIGTGVLGVAFAWLVTMYDFWGRRWFEVAFLLPLAIPGYIMGFVFVATFEYAGGVQSTLRAWFGTSEWFPKVHSPLGLMLVLSLVLYPYVYIMARAAFRDQAASTFEMARLCGLNRWQTFIRLVLPMARPSLAVGVLLAMMEAMTDYGTVSFFGYPTLSERVVVLWNQGGQRGQSIQVAALFLLLALVLMVVERILRGQASYVQQGIRGRRLKRVRLGGFKQAIAVLASVALMGMAFVLPVFQLVGWAIQEVQDPSVGLWKEVFTTYLRNSVALATTAAMLTVLLALLIVSLGRMFNMQQGWLRRLPLLATLGYSLPGGVIATGVLVTVSPLDADITRWFNSMVNRTDPSTLLLGTIAALVYAYVVRFMSIGYNGMESNMQKITPNMEAAARTMHASSWRILTRIHLPLLSSGMVAACILIFVDVLKELPATLLLRPFGMDTLAIWAYFMSNEGFWQSASIPSLTILVSGLLPVFLLMRVGESKQLDEESH